MTTEKHFSPDSERNGGSIPWREWGPEAFEDAEKEDKPVLLSIGGSWCHWCHVMDGNTYSDRKVADEISKNFIPIRVDTDERPDINNRYNLGGWPTTAFLTPEGEIITGGTYIPPEKMLEIIGGVRRLYQKDPVGLKRGARAYARPARRPVRRKLTRIMVTKRKGRRRETETFADLLGYAADQIQEKYDARYGGFGTYPKFPMPEALELAQVACLYLERDPGWEKIFVHTLRSMFTGGVYDAVEGGFFRYSTTRDWSIPHYEKMLEDNAQLLHLLLTTSKFTGDEFFADAARDILKYLENELYLPEIGGWAGSQAADEEYYALPLDERQKRGKPGIDRNVYVNWNALLARTLFHAAVILSESKWYDYALNTLYLLRQNCYQPDWGMAHFLAVEGSEAQVWGLLEDQVFMGLASTAAYQASGEPDWLNFSRELAEYCLKNLSTERGALSDRPLKKQEPGRLAHPHFDLRTNSHCARWFTELASLTGEEAYLEKAADLVHSFMGEYRRHALFSTSLALAALGIRERGAMIDVVGTAGDPDLLPLHSTALAAFVPPKVVRLISPEQAREWGREEYASVQQATAFACLGMHCFEPSNTPQELEQVVEKMIKERRAHVLFTVKKSKPV